MSGGGGDGVALVRELDLSHNNIDGADTRVVVAIQNLASQARPSKPASAAGGGGLAVLALTGNCLGPRGGRAVALMLQKMRAARGGEHTGLERLSLGQNNLGDQV